MGSGPGLKQGWLGNLFLQNLRFQLNNRRWPHDPCSSLKSNV